jgi:Divergent InlB B-repeat domain
MISLVLAIILAWDSSATPPPVSGYRLKYGTQPRIYTVVQDAGTATQAEVTGLAPGAYYFATFAYNDAGESIASNEVQYVQAEPVPTPTPTPTPSGPTIEASRLAIAPNELFQAIVRDGPGNTTDWVTLALIEDPITVDRDYWKYLTNARTIPPTGITDATLTFSTPVSGTYELRFYANNDFILIARSGPIIVATVPTPTPTPQTRAVTVKTIHIPGEQVNITAPASVNGKAFQTWTGDTGALANPQSNQTTLTVPTSLDVEVEARY